MDKCNSVSSSQAGVADSAGTFKVTLSMKKEPNGGPVYCKMDGQRFKQAKTVKLHTDTTYRIDVSFKPPRSLQSVVVLGREMPATERSRDSTASAFSSYYSTQGVQPSKKGHRVDLLVVMKVRETGELSTCLQIKFYRSQDVQHCEWGSRLHCIELDCSCCQGALSVTVNKETYRKLGWMHRRIAGHRAANLSALRVHRRTQILQHTSSNYMAAAGVTFGLAACTDEASEGNWIWSGTGQALTVTFYDEYHHNIATENCLITHRSGILNLTWHDLPCSEAHPFICELI